MIRMTNVPRNTATTYAFLIAASAIATSLYIFNTRKRRRTDRNSQSDDDIADTAFTANEHIHEHNDDEATFYKHLGISEENLPPHIRREIEKERRRKAKEEYISMKSPMYDNVFMLDQNRNPMCTISMKKARWYVRKGIAEWCEMKEEDEGGKRSDEYYNGKYDKGYCGNVQNNANGTIASDNANDNVKCIRILFKPSGGTYQSEGTSENLYLKTAKKNICVACGNDGNHMRHYIVPYAYRTLLPDQFKSHMSHDIVILCPDCHVECERATKRRMKVIEKETRERVCKEMGEKGIELMNCSPVIDDTHLHHVRSCAIALAKWKNNMPQEKIESHESVVRGYLASICKKDEERASLLDLNVELTKSQLQKACSVKYRVKNPDYVSGSEFVVRSLNEDQKKIESFVIEWRKHFLGTVNPRFMPVGWKVDNPVVCGRRDDSADDSVKKW